MIKTLKLINSGNRTKRYHQNYVALLQHPQWGSNILGKWYLLLSSKLKYTDNFETYSK